MIRVLIIHEPSDELLAEIEIERIKFGFPGAKISKYTARVVVDRGNDILGIYQVPVGLWARKNNVLSLLYKVLHNLTDEQMELEKDFDLDNIDQTTVSSAMERKERGAMSTLQVWKRGPRPNRSSLWRGQQK